MKIFFTIIYLLVFFTVSGTVAKEHAFASNTAAVQTTLQSSSNTGSSVSTDGVNGVDGKDGAVGTSGTDGSSVFTGQAGANTIVDTYIDGRRVTEIHTTVTGEATAEATVATTTVDNGYETPNISTNDDSRSKLRDLIALLQALIDTYVKLLQH